MVVPALLGYYVDKCWGTRVLFTILGAAFGLAFGIWQLLEMARASDKGAGTATERESPGSPDTQRKQSE
jgi:F0F1-type ATP synthase assembly protein I